MWGRLLEGCLLDKPPKMPWVGAWFVEGVAGHACFEGVSRVRCAWCFGSRKCGCNLFVTRRVASYRGTCGVSLVCCLGPTHAAQKSVPKSREIETCGRSGVLGLGPCSHASLRVMQGRPRNQSKHAPPNSEPHELATRTRTNQPTRASIRARP